MTTILGVEYPDKAYLIADTLISDGNVTYHDSRMSKITTSGQYLIGVAGDVGICNIINHIWKPPAPTVKDKNLFKFIITTVVPNLRDTLEKNQAKKDSEFQIIIAIKGKIFEIDSDFATAVHHSGLYAIGSGGDYARGVLEYGATPREAIEISAKLDPQTGGEFQEFEQWIRE